MSIESQLAAQENSGEGGSSENVREERSSHMNTMVMPWFMGGPWVPIFNGKTDVKFSEWRTRIESYLRAQGLGVVQKIDFVLNALEGDPKREVLLLSAADRDTDDKILDFLANLYQPPQSIAYIRDQFFSCKQDSEEGVSSFILRFREFYSRWGIVDPGGANTDEVTLRDQFALALQPGPVQRELQRLIRRTTGMTFIQACSEARALEKELLRHGEVGVNRILEATPTSGTSSQQAPQQQTIPPQELQQLKDTLRAELHQEIAAQMSTLGKVLVEELKGQLAGMTLAMPQHMDAPQRPQRPTSATMHSAQGFQWDAQGRPICRGCGESGHVQRNCPRRRPGPPGFRGSRPL